MSFTRKTLVTTLLLNNSLCVYDYSNYYSARLAASLVRMYGTVHSNEKMHRD
jgi:hypothetical protein